MPFQEQLGAAIAAARNNSQLDALNQQIISAWGDRLLDDAAAGAAIEALETRRQSLRGNPPSPARKPFCAPRRPPRPRSPDRHASIRRRRREIAPRNIPPGIAENFTPGELAALSVIAKDIAINGRCVWCVDKIAAIAGCSARTVQRAQRLAERLGFIEIEARPRRGRKSETNIIRIAWAEWAAWLRLDRVTGKSRPGIRKNNSLLTARQDPASWRFHPAAPAPLGSAKGWRGEIAPLRRGPRAPGEPHDRLAAALARAEAILREKRPVNLLAR